MRKGFALLIATAVLAIWVPACSPPLPAGKVEWHQVFIRGQPAGYLQLSELPRPGGGYLVRTLLKLRVSRRTTPLELDSVEEIEEDREGKILGFVLEQRLSRRTTTTRGRVRGRVLEVSTQVEGSKTRASELPFDPRSVGSRRMRELARKRLRKPGDTFDCFVFVSETQSSKKATMTMGPLEETELIEGRRRLRQLRTEFEGLPIAITAWVDEEFRDVKTSTPLGGMELVTYRSSREALLRGDRGAAPEIFMSSAIPVHRSVPATAAKARYRLEWKGEAPSGRPSLNLPAGAGQELLRKENGAWILEVRVTAPPQAAARSSPPPEELLPFLAASSFIQMDDPKILAVAREATAGEKDRWKAAKQLERWVYRNVEAKHLHTAFATSTEVMELREGDCTEHAVLLAALARAAGIPARLVAGLLYMNGSFVGHMWTEVHCGEWIPLDGTIGAGSVGPDHIALATSSLNDTTMYDFFLKLVPALGNLGIQVLAVEGRSGD